MITDLRYIERDGEKVLQYCAQYGEKGHDWKDVPTLTKGPAVLITSAEFWEAANEVLPAIQDNALNYVNRENFKMLAKKLGLEGRS